MPRAYCCVLFYIAYMTCFLQLALCKEPQSLLFMKELYHTIVNNFQI